MRQLHSDPDITPEPKGFADRTTVPTELHLRLMRVHSAPATPRVIWVREGKQWTAVKRVCHV